MGGLAYRILVRAPGEWSQLVELGDAQQVVIGRNPDPARVDGMCSTVSVASPSVSANHVYVRRDGHRIHVADLGSRNGTLVEARPKQEIIVEAGTEPISIHLAPSLDASATPDAPSDASWTGRKDFAAGVCEAIGVWLEARSLSARATVVERSHAARVDAARRIPLATGEDLSVEPRGTVGGEWRDALVRIERWLLHQNLLFATEESMRAEGLVVASAAMRKVVARVVAAATSGARVVLITGPSGAGKEGLARCFHRHTARAGPFVARNCAMFSKDLVRSELFGAEKGAFTGSVQRIVGAVEIASEGTLFLDEIGELPREIQPMLLRFLDHGEYERLGGYGKPKMADVRIVAATNRDLRAAVLADEFRTDLWFRLSVHVVEVPPLRERGDDVVAYLQAQRLAPGTSLLDALAPETVQLLLSHDWPGNFRELANFVERCLPLAANGGITAKTATRLLEEGALVPPKVGAAGLRSETTDGDTFLTTIQRARAAYAEDHGGETPATWDQIKNLIENYVKPILFASLSESATEEGLESVDLRVAAERLRADRGTASKQLRRYFDRFASERSKSL
ncbi:MAG: sigma 54-interacting transcriptional regulator [Labilithrix sp.]|nr:sigma 54-interacting transcriptional regulator [Labilithrix sp.]